MVDIVTLAMAKAIGGGGGGQPGTDIHTINGILPDGANDFTIEAGTGATVTPGTNKITVGTDALFRRIHITDTAPTSQDGQDGDLWVVLP